METPNALPFLGALTGAPPKRARDDEPAPPGVAAYLARADSRERAEYEALTQGEEAIEVAKLRVFHAKLRVWHDATLRVSNWLNDTVFARESPLMVCDVMGPVLDHMDLLGRVTAAAPGQEARDPKGYMLSPSVLDAFLHSRDAGGHNVAFLRTVLSFLKPALGHAMPQLATFSMLSWHSMEALLPLIDFIFDLTSPYQGPARDGLVSERRLAYTAGAEAFELLLSWCDQIWGLSRIAPNAHLLKDDALWQVEGAMKRLGERWGADRNPSFQTFWATALREDED